jgi:hypothetical protein
MGKDILRYDRMVQDALRGVVRDALAQVALHGLPARHHFFITFRTDRPGVAVPDQLRARYPDEMTVVLQHQFSDLEVSQEAFSVTLTFDKMPSRLVVPFAAITRFVDPPVNFGLQLTPPGAEGVPAEGGAAIPPAAPASSALGAQRPHARPGAAPDEGAGKGEAKVVALDSFRKP